MRERRDVAVESLRGLAVILMVAGHVIGFDSSRGLQVSDDSLWRLGYLSLEDLRMPLFTAISGLVYAWRPVCQQAGYRRLVRGKIRRLLVPLLTVGTLLFTMQLVVPGVNRRSEPTDAWRIYVFGFEHLWFLQAIFLIFVIVGLLDAVGALDQLRRWALALAVACLLNLLAQVPAEANVFSINGATHLLPFFLLGLGFCRFPASLDSRWWLIWSLPTFAVVLGLHLVLLLVHVQASTFTGRLLSLTVGLSGLMSVFLLRRKLKNAALAWIGSFSFAVYLLHVFAAAAARMALQHMGIEIDAVLFALCLSAGVGLPILFAVTFGRFSLISWSILGQKPSPRSRPRVAAQRFGTRAPSRPKRSGTSGPEGRVLPNRTPAPRSGSRHGAK